MQAVESKEIVRRFIDEYQTGADETAFAELLHPDVVDHSRPPGIAPGAEGVRQQFDGFRAGLPDFRATILHQVAEDDLVMTHKVFHGTHTGELLGIPGSGKHVAWRQSHIMTVADGRATTHRAIRDDLGLMRQMGALPGG